MHMTKAEKIQKIPSKNRHLQSVPAPHSRYLAGIALFLAALIALPTAGYAQEKPDNRRPVVASPNSGTSAATPANRPGGVIAPKTAKPPLRTGTTSMSPAADTAMTLLPVLKPNDPLASNLSGGLMMNMISPSNKITLNDLKDKLSATPDPVFKTANHLYVLGLISQLKAAEAKTGK